MEGLHITHHAIERYQERIDPTADEATARAALDTPATRAAAEFGATTVRLGTGERVVIKNHTVVTILPAANYRAQVCRQNIAPQVRNRKNYTNAFNGRNDNG